MLFQTLGVMIIAVGPKKTVHIFVKYPPLMLISAFSFWTIGPISPSSKCCNMSFKSKYLGVSFWHTWINVLLVSLTVPVVMLIIYSDLEGWRISYFVAFLCPVIGALPIIILQKFKCKICCNCSQISTKFTVLNIENLDRLTSIDEITKDNEHYDSEMDVIQICNHGLSMRYESSC